MRLFGAFVVAAALATIGSMADAATCRFSSDKNQSTFTLGDASGAECFSGNDSNQIDSSFEIFGKTGWVLAQKNEESARTSRRSSAPSSSSPISITSGLTNGTKSGSWEVSGWGGLGTGDVIITLKAGKGFGAFLVDTSSTTGSWTSSKDLSHASIYFREITPVPLPAGGVLLLSALAGFGLFRRFRPA